MTPEEAAAWEDLSALAGLIMITEINKRMDETCPCAVCAWVRSVKEKDD